MPIGLFALATVWDLRTGRIPHWLSGATLFAGVSFYVIEWGVQVGLAQAVVGSLFGALCTGLVPWLLWLGSKPTQGKPAIGGGDVYLLASVGAFYGARDGLEAELIALAVASTVVLAGLAWKGRLFATLWNFLRTSAAPFLPRRYRTEPSVHMTQRIRMAPSVLLAALWLHRADLGWTL